MNKPCKFADKPKDVWECICYRKTYCADQISIQEKDEIRVVCGYAKRLKEGEK